MGVTAVVDCQGRVEAECVIQCYTGVVDHDEVSVAVGVLARAQVLCVTVVRFVCSRLSISPTRCGVLNLGIRIQDSHVDFTAVVGR